MVFNCLYKLSKSKYCPRIFLAELILLLVCFQGEPKKKKTTKTEKYWDWELANETKPLWVSLGALKCVLSSFKMFTD